MWIQPRPLLLSVAITMLVGAGATGAGEPRTDRTRNSPPTALDRYVATPDTNYTWRLVQTFQQDGVAVHVLSMTSQAWLSTNEVDKPLWPHWLTLTVPADVTNTTALLVVSGGSNDKPAPTKVDGVATLLARTTRSVVATLSGIPSQPITFADRTNSMKEDALIAYTWARYLRTGDERWPARLPMTKAVVRAMDTVTAFCASEAGGRRAVDTFFVMGASKRGWTTWTTAAVDPRVIAIAPVVIDVLNVRTSLVHHYEDYGFFAPAVGNYAHERITDWLDTPEFERLMQIEDPFAYRARLTLPKFIVTAAGDQFFPTDSARFYFDDLPGPKYLRAVPNADHDLKVGNPWFSVLAFYDAILKGAPLPEFGWKTEADGAVRVTAKTRPASVKLWQATNPDARDFRLESFGSHWTSTDLAPETDGTWVARIPKPGKGWTAFFVELTFPSTTAMPFTFTTLPTVVPDTRPHRWVPAGPPAKGGR